MAVRLWTMLCRRFQDYGGTVSLQHVFSTAAGGSLPARIAAFSVVSAFEGELGEEFSYRLKFETPDGKPHGATMDAIHHTIRRNPDFLCVEFAGYPFYEYGTYTIEVEMNGNPVHIVELKILGSPPSGDAQPMLVGSQQMRFEDEAE